MLTVAKPLYIAGIVGVYGMPGNWRWWGVAVVQVMTGIDM